MPKFLPHGTTFSFNGQLVGGLIGVGFPSASKGEAETTDTDSGGDREFIAGLRDHGEVSVVVRYDPEDAGQIELEDNFDAAGLTTAQCIITLPAPATAGATTVTYTFDGWVNSSREGDLDLVADESAEVSFGVRVTGGVTKANV